MYLYFHLLPFSTFEWISPFIHYFSTKAMLVTFLFITSEQHTAEIQFAKPGNIGSDNNAANCLSSPLQPRRSPFPTCLTSYLALASGLEMIFHWTKLFTEYNLLK